MSELTEKVKTSIERLKAFEPRNGEGYYLAFSGGKDSVVCKALMDMAGVKYDSTYRVTSVDPPELVRFIKEKQPDVKMEIPHDKDGNPITMWNLIPLKRVPPTQLYRYCCQILKESGGDGRKTVTGVRWAESSKRKASQGLVTIKSRRGIKEADGNEDFRENKHGGVILVNDNDDSRRLVEQCYKRHKTNLNPIIDWSDAEVWEFINAEGIEYCGLYNEGYHRLGCIGCPMARDEVRWKDFARYEGYKKAYIRAFERMIEGRKERHEREPKYPVWKEGGREYDNPTAEQIFHWWMRDGVLVGQASLFEEADE